MMPPGTSPDPTSFTIGSLVDTRSQSMLSSPTSYAAGLTSSGNGGAAPTSSASLQYGFQSTPCGAANFFTL
jgi:hypothetical protein